MNNWEIVREEEYYLYMLQLEMLIISLLNLEVQLKIFQLMKIIRLTIAP